MRLRAEPDSGNHPREIPQPLGFPSSMRDEIPTLLLHNPAGLGFPPGAPHLPYERLSLSGV